MMKINIQCNQQFMNTIKRKLQLYFNDIDYVDCLSEGIVCIKEIKDLDDIETLSKNGLDYIFIIDSGEYMFELLEYSPISFIRVMNIEGDIEKVIRILQCKNKGVGKILEFKVGYQNIRIDSDNIEYIESYGHYLFIHTLSAVFKVREKISNILSKLESLGFLRVHKSYIVNTNHISVKKINELKMKSGAIIPIGDTYKSIVRKNK